MNSLKPFAFWVAIGAVLAVELVIYVAALPDVDLVGNALAARASKAELDREYLHLAELDRKAKSGSPQGVFDAESADDIKKLTDDFLITGTWKAVLDPHVEKYEKHLKDIQAHLKERSAVLHKPLADSGDKLGWYTAYQGATEALLKQLNAAGCLVIPAVVTASKEPAKEGNKSVPTDAGAVLADIDFAVAKEVRDVAGFYTKISDYPEASEHPTLTTRFRIVERLAGLILESGAANTPSTVTVTDVPVPTKSTLRSLTWGDQVAAPGGGVAAYGTGINLTMTLEGTLSSLLATQSVIERSDLGPVIVVIGTSISRKSAYAPGERKDVPSERGELKLNLMVLDLNGPSVAPATAQPAAEPEGAPPAVQGHKKTKRPEGQLSTEGEGQ